MQYNCEKNLIILLIGNLLIKKSFDHFSIKLDFKFIIYTTLLLYVHIYMKININKIDSTWYNNFI